MNPSELGKRYDDAIVRLEEAAGARLAGTLGSAEHVDERVARQVIGELVGRIGGLGGEGDEVLEAIANAAFDDLYRLGPLEELLEDTRFTEIMVNAPDDVRVEMDGVIYRTDAHFRDDDHVLGVCTRLAVDDDRHCDKATPICDCTLHRRGASFDGSRVNLTIPPVVVDHPLIDIRKFRQDVLTPKALIDLGTMDERCGDLLEALVLARMNIIVIGGTGSGKTTTLNVISSYIPDSQRIATIEDTVELKLAKDQVIRHQTRQRSIEGTGEITIHDLVKNSLRERPDRIVVGECRDGAAFEMLQAMSTGHDGSLATIHANNARDALSRLQMMVQMSDAAGNMNPESIMRVITSAVDIIVEVRRWPDGHRRIAEVVEVCGMEGDTPTLEPLIGYDEASDSWISRGARLTPGHRARFRTNGVPVNEGWWS